MQQDRVVVGDIFTKYDNPIAQIVQKACSFESDLYALGDNCRANLKSIMGIMAFNWNEGSSVTIQGTGVDEAEAVDAIVKYLKCE